MLSMSSSNSSSNMTFAQDNITIFDESAQRRMVEIVENFLSDESLVRHNHVQKELRKKDRVNISLIIRTCKSIKSITDSSVAVCDAIRMISSKLEVVDGEKIRRITPLPQTDCTDPCYRTVVLLNLPPEKENFNEILRDFRRFGEISHIRVISSDSKHPNHNKLREKIYRTLGDIPQDRAIGTIEFNFTRDAEECILRQAELHSMEPVWASTELHLLQSENRHPVFAQIFRSLLHGRTITAEQLQEFLDSLIRLNT